MKSLLKTLGSRGWSGTAFLLCGLFLVKALMALLSFQAEAFIWALAAAAGWARADMLDSNGVLRWIFRLGAA